MDKSTILSYLGDHPWAQHIVVYDQVSSTNTLVKALGQQGTPHGTVMIADRQSAGRGRLGRSFLSPGGVGVYLSALIRPDAAPAQIMHLTCAAAVAICDAVEAAAHIRPSIKWTNDLVIGKRKVAGILTELALDPRSQKVDYAVIGIGINCCQQVKDFDESIRDMATSLALATGTDIDRSRLTAEMIRSLADLSEKLLTDKDAILKQYAADCITIGQEIQLTRGDVIRYGRAIGIDSDGGLVVTYDSGESATVSSGEVSVRGMYGYV